MLLVRECPSKCTRLMLECCLCCREQKRQALRESKRKPETAPEVSAAGPSSSVATEHAGKSRKKSSLGNGSAKKEAKEGKGNESAKKAAKEGKGSAKKSKQLTPTSTKGDGSSKKRRTAA